MAKKTLTQQIADAEEQIAALKSQNAALKETQGNQYGAHIQDVYIDNKAASVSKRAASALYAAALAAQENAKAIAAIASAARGAEAHMGNGISLSNVKHRD